MLSPCWTGRIVLAIAVVLTAWLEAADDAPPKPLTPVEARKKVGEEIVVEMEVRTAKDRLEKRGEIYLDSSSISAARRTSPPSSIATGQRSFSTME
jgi:hypothetical protein